MNKKVVVVGLDGGSWNLLKLWINKGWLPNLKRIIEEGVWGELQSTIPSLTGPAWVTFATGRNPGSHGCYNFLIPRGSLLETELIDGEMIEGETFYEILERHGKRSIIINLPCSFPPRIKKGILLPSFLTRDEQEVYPKEITQKIPEIKKYRVITSPVTWLDRGDSLVKAIRDLESVNFEIAKKLFQRYQWDFFFILFSGSDRIQHQMYRRLMKAKDINEAPLKFYQDFDGYLGWFLNHLPSRSTMIVLSDHGFGPVKYYFHLNKLLEDKGLLNTKKVFLKRKTNLPLAPRLITKGKTNGISPFFLKKFFKLIFSNQPLYFLSGELARFFERVLPNVNLLPLGLLSAGIELDIGKTLACTLPGTFSSVYINDRARFKDGIVGRKDYEKVRNKIIRELKRLRNPGGNKVFKSVYRKEEIYYGSTLALAPDILLLEDETTATSYLGRKNLFEKAEKEGGWHRLNGIFLAYGKGIRKGEKISHAHLQDIAPTILDLFGLPIPEEIEGRVLLDILKVSSSKIEEKTKKSRKIIRKALKDFPPDKMAIAWTGGKDSTLLLWLIREACREKNLSLPKIVFIDEGDVFPEVKKFVRDLAKKWKLKVTFVRNDDVLKQANKIGDLVQVSKLDKRNRWELKRLDFKGKSFLFEPESFIGNHLMKTVPLNLYLEKMRVKALFTGIRRDEHEARSQEKYFSPREKPSHARIHPLLHLTESDVWGAIRLFSVPYNPLYEKGYRSLGVKSTTEKISDQPAWRQDLKKIRERAGRRQDKEKIMQRLRDLGYM